MLPRYWIALIEADSKPLAGLGILVPRPAPQAAAFGAIVEQNGGKAIVFPVIDIVPPNDNDALVNVLQDLKQVDLIFFVSVHAVHGVCRALRQHRFKIPSRIRVAAVGPATVKELKRANIQADFAPDMRIDSEGLSETLRDTDVRGKNILIFRAQSGREWLKQNLETRGARVRHIESYRRQVTNRSIEPLLMLWQGGEINWVLVTSVAIWDALVKLVAPSHQVLLETTPICTYSERVRDYCRKNGARAKIIVAEHPAPESVVRAISTSRS